MTFPRDIYVFVGGGQRDGFFICRGDRRFVPGDQRQGRHQRAGYIRQAE